MKRKTNIQDDGTSGNANEMDDKMPTQTATMAEQLNKPVGELRLRADDDASTLATQENPLKKIVYITNMPEDTLETSENVRDSSKNTNEEDDRKPSPVEKTDQITSNVQLNAYEESDREEDSALPDTRLATTSTATGLPRLPMRQKPWAGDHRTR